MRKKRNQYKRSQRLGYNAIGRVWFGKKKKWEKHRIWNSQASISTTQLNSSKKLEKGEGRVVNPRARLTNAKRMGSVEKSTERIRRKDVHGRMQNQRTGRKRRYGGIPREEREKTCTRYRTRYQKKKVESERRYRKGRRKASERQKRTRESHRRAGTERRADVRRWRSGRVQTIQSARDLIEHGKVRTGTGQSDGSELKWYGKSIQVGGWRKRKEEAWKKRKEQSRKSIQKTEDRKTGLGYAQVDYVTGRRVLIRVPGSMEVVVPKGMELSLWNLKK